MFLGVDIGNSNIVLGIFDDGKWQDIFRIPTHQEELSLPSSFTEKYIPHIKKSALSSVVPSVTPKVLALLKQFNIAPYVIGKASYPLLKISINNEEEIGTDLVANAVQAHELFSNDKKMVVDFGTALTFTPVASDGRLLGVAIAPGIKTAMYSLFTNAEQLPEVPLELPESALGSDTIHALQAGVLLGYVGLVEGMIKRIKAEIGEECKVIATGGLAFVLKPLHSLFDVMDVHLTLDGIRNIYLQASEKGMS